VSASGIRLAELVALLSLGTDLGLGQPMEHVLRQCLIAQRLAEHLDMDEDEREVLYYTALLAYVGCHVDAHEQARWLGDDLTAKADAHFYDLEDAREGIGYLIGHLGAGRPPLERLRLGLAFLTGDGRHAVDAMFENHSIATRALATDLGLGEPVIESLDQTFERWDGKGLLGLHGANCSIAARLTVLADAVEVFHRTGGIEAAVSAARERSGTQFDPKLVELFADNARDILDKLDAISTWEQVIDSEPLLDHRCLSDDELDQALEAVADFVDLKSPHTLGHSRRVADLAAAGSLGAGLPSDEARAVRRAALLHDIGRLGVPNTIWDKPGPLTQPEWERVRLHPYLSERMISYSPTLAPLAPIAGAHHERLDGSGYQRGLNGSGLTLAMRILAAADAYAAMTEPRPHREPHTPDDARKLIRAEVRDGRLDADAADAVLAAAGHPVSRRREGPAGLTTREVQVLRLIARGYSSKEIAETLVITRKTARNHVQHIYEKVGVSNRAQASMFAVSHGLMSDYER
jgi:HD-GYP domain-containing protein (c-di-GMP phosphodiesterase class II)